MCRQCTVQEHTRWCCAQTRLSQQHKQTNKQTKNKHCFDQNMTCSSMFQTASSVLIDPTLLQQLEQASWLAMLLKWARITGGLFLFLLIWECQLTAGCENICNRQWIMDQVDKVKCFFIQATLSCNHFCCHGEWHFVLATMFSEKVAQFVTSTEYDLFYM